MNKITTYNDLLLEKQRLRLLLEEKKILVETEFEEIKIKLKPITHFLAVVEKLTSKDRSNPLINTGIDLGVNFLLKNVLLRNAGFIVKFLVPALTKNYLSHEVEDGNNIFSRISSFIKKKVKEYLPA